MKNTTIIVLTILLLAVIGAGAYYWQATNGYKNQINNLQQLNNVNQPSNQLQNQVNNLINSALPTTLKHYTIQDDYLIETPSGKKLLAAKVSSMVFPEADKQLSGGYLDPAQEWLQFTQNNKVYLYVLRVAGCGGCAWTDHYFEIDPATDKAVLKTPPEDFGGLAKGVISPNKTLVAIAEVTNPNESIYSGKAVAESIWIYNLTNNTKRKIKDMPIGATAFYCGDGCYTDGDALTWNGNTSITINPFIAPRKNIETRPDYIESDPTHYGEQWTINL